MPELPEVETVRRGLALHLENHRLAGAQVRDGRLRWPVSAELAQRLRGQIVRTLERRGKYLLFRCETGSLICHLGMSGSLRLHPPGTPPGRHDHVDLLLEDGRVLRFHDPRRFGAMVWTEDAAAHPLLAGLGVEPLSPEFGGSLLHRLCQHRSCAIKALLMDARRVVGIGNIYANEALFHAGIDPRLAAGRLSRRRCDRLAEAVRTTLHRAIAAGGSTLRDFVDGDGKPGYFQQTYYVYGRSGENCRNCGTPIRQIRQLGRSSFFCPSCQKP